MTASASRSCSSDAGSRRGSSESTEANASAEAAAPPLYIFDNNIRDAGCVSLIAALDSGSMPALKGLGLLPDADESTVSDEARQALRQACERRGISD